MNDPFEKSNPTQAEYFKDIVGTIRDPLVVLDAGLRVLAANGSQAVPSLPMQPI